MYTTYPNLLVLSRIIVKATICPQLCKASLSHDDLNQITFTSRWFKIQQGIVAFKRLIYKYIWSIIAQFHKFPYL